MDDFMYSVLAGIVGGLVTGSFFHLLQKLASARSKEAFFKALKNPNKWSTRDSEIYFHNDKPEFSIEVGDWDRSLNPTYYNHYAFPDKENNALVPIKLKIHDKEVDGTLFMTLDGGRNLVPLPRSQYKSEDAKEEDHYIFWDLEHFDFDLYKIIGEIYRDENIEAFAKKTGIRLKNQRASAK